MLARALERAHSSALRRTMYRRFIFTLLTIVLAFKATWFYRSDRSLIDFDLFHIASEHFWLGDLDRVYDFLSLVELEKNSAVGKTSFMPWTYPPQFDLLVAPLSFFPVGCAYFLFIGTTLIFYLVILWQISGDRFSLLLLILLPALLITLVCGQNGFLTGGLIGLACLSIERRQALAGLSLGMMVIKPHLAVALAVYSVLARKWIAILVAGVVVLASSLLCTLILGPRIWTAFLVSAHVSAIFLDRGYYPLFRMISTYASLRAIGCSATVAFSGQGVVAAIGLSFIVVAAYRHFPIKWTLGIAALVSVQISPYAYDYDLPILGVGLALLLPDLMNLAYERERSAIFGLIIAVGFYSSLQSIRLKLQFGDGADLSDRLVPSIGGVLLFLMLAVAFNVLGRHVATRSTALLP
ncbi:DUF2029 domain-containing protein [Bradyrhizobium arachidis]|uniref:glycosyltransferase family 87 protein n=1 Tax=Bradyrhizobium arachidis TaxID=858423 RepID=UPI0021622950|nr:glycosyltransferase family 87 protein [Bradyrhizobium arachidis]UVO39414.1 DUF2029 domain-containing protein [Bradyrhizobium arachidis]